MATAVVGPGEPIPSLAFRVLAYEKDLPDSRRRHNAGNAGNAHMAGNDARAGGNRWVHCKRRRLRFGISEPIPSLAISSFGGRKDLLDSRRLYLGSINILWLLSRPKGRNFRGEELGRGRRETESPQGRQNLFGRLARLPRAAPFKRPNRILGPSTQGGNIGARVYKAVSERYAPKR